jgi:1-acyl-sn-glycerol-3-phosphate acyltransferase
MTAANPRMTRLLSGLDHRRQEPRPALDAPVARGLSPDRVTATAAPALRRPRDERDLDLIRSILPFLNFLSAYYFRTEYEGEQHVPKDGRFIAVANHNGGPILADAWMMLAWWWSHFGPEYPAYALVHDTALNVPVVGDYLVRLGALRANRENAERVIADGGTLLIYPGGVLDCLKPFWRRNVVDFHGRTGFVELAIKRGIPILPVVNAGGHEVYFTLWSSPTLARWTGLAALTGVRTLPINVGLPWGVWPTGFLPFLPLPAKFHYKVGKPMYFGHDPDIERKPEVVRRVYGRITATMQRMLDSVVRKRRLPVLG